MTQKISGEGPTGFGTEWFHAWRVADGQQLTMVRATLHVPELAVVQPATALLRASPDQALAVALCLRTAAYRFVQVIDEAELMVESDSGDGWRPVRLAS
jgi:hypothetical protein